MIDERPVLLTALGVLGLLMVLLALRVAGVIR